MKNSTSLDFTVASFASPLQLAEFLRHKKNFVWLDSLLPNNSFATPQEQGLSLLAAEPDLILEGGPNDWHLLEKELTKRLKAEGCRQAIAKRSQFSLLTSQFSVNKPSLRDSNREQQTINPERETSLAQQGQLTTDNWEPTTAVASQRPGAAIGFFRYDGSFRFGFYEKVHRFFSEPTETSVQQTVIPHDEQKMFTNPFFKPEITAAEFCQQVRAAQEEIAAGNIYQVCLAHRFRAKSTIEDPWPFYLALRKHSPAPFAAYLNLGEETILSSSPECFLKIEGRHIVTRPIKGTRPRGKSKEDDERLAQELQHSSKEKAELVMITDLLRNDLGRVCDYGTIATPQLLTLERYPQVFHLVSTIEGELRKEVSHVEALAACFPGGSISGAPKKKAMEIIERLESAPRGLFTGAIGYFGFDGKSQFNIAIRTVTIRDGMAEFHVGAGITCNSLPEEEWQETLHKAAGILAAA